MNKYGEPDERDQLDMAEREYFRRNLIDRLEDYVDYVNWSNSGWTKNDSAVSEEQTRKLILQDLLGLLPDRMTVSQAEHGTDVEMDARVHNKLLEDITAAITDYVGQLDEK